MAGICTCGFERRAQAGTHTADGDEICNACDRFVDRSRTSVTSRPSATSPGTPFRAADADGVIATAFWVGLGLVILGGVILGASWPGQEVTFDSTAQTGSATGVMVGLVVAGIGQCAILFAIISWAVKFGMRAAPRR